MRMINVYEDKPGVYGLEGRIIARVRSTKNLDYWNGSNYQNPSMGNHKGITKLTNGNFVIICTSQWEGSTNYGYLVTPEIALQEILESDNDELLDLPMFSDLKKLHEELLIESEE